MSFCNVSLQALETWPGQVVATGDSINTNPHRHSEKNRDGEPIADRFQVAVCGNRTLMVLADGCGWGNLLTLNVSVAMF